MLWEVHFVGGAQMCEEQQVQDPAFMLPVARCWGFPCVCPVMLWYHIVCKQCFWLPFWWLPTVLSALASMRAPQFINWNNYTINRFIPRNYPGCLPKLVGRGVLHSTKPIWTTYTGLMKKLQLTELRRTFSPVTSFDAVTSNSTKFAFISCVIWLAHACSCHHHHLFQQVKCVVTKSNV